MRVRDSMNPALPWRPPASMMRGLALLLVFGSMWPTRADAAAPPPAPPVAAQEPGGKENEDEASLAKAQEKLAAALTQAEKELAAAKTDFKVARSNGDTAKASDAQARVVMAEAWLDAVKAQQEHAKAMATRLAVEKVNKAKDEADSKFKWADAKFKEADKAVTVAEKAVTNADDAVKIADKAVNAANAALKDTPTGQESAAKQQKDALQTKKTQADEKKAAAVATQTETKTQHGTAVTERAKAESALTTAKTALEDEKKTLAAQTTSLATAKEEEESKQSMSVSAVARVERRALSGAFSLFDCDERLVFCLNSDGQHFGQEVSPTLRVGELLRVRIIDLSTTSDEERATITLTVNHVTRTESLFARSASGKNLFIDVPPTYKLLTEAELKVLDEQSVLVDFRRESLNPDEPTEVETYSLPIDHGTYYLQVGLGVPFVVNGERKVVTAPLAGSSERLSVVEEDLHVGATLMVNVFPFGGRRDGQLWFCTNGCRWGDALGFQVGLKLDTDNPFDEWYAGAVFEPIAGLAISGGLALVQGQYLTQGAEDGILVNGNPETVMRFMPRPYLGFTLTPDILDTLTEARTRLSGSSL